MVSQYKSVTRDIGFEASAKKIKQDPYDVLIVASIIEKEVNKEQYRAKVARVLYNRLAKDRKLELDSTVVVRGEAQDQHDDAEGPPEPVEVQHLPVQGPAAGTDLGARARPPCRPRPSRTRASGSTS